MPQTRKKRQTVERVMHEFKQGDLESGSGRKVRNPKQAIAIALSESGQSRKKRGQRAASKSTRGRGRAATRTPAKSTTRRGKSTRRSARG